jgi:hypothetical protein
MKRWVAGLFLVLLAFYLGASRYDHCGGCPDDQGQVCHILCSDGCATAPIPGQPSPPSPDPLPRPVYDAALPHPVLNVPREPEKTPPRA